MKTIKIKVEIEAEVPEGKYCGDSESGDCEKLNQDGEPLMESCDIFPKAYLKYDHKMECFIKCQTCLDACEE